jgi:type IV secretion system protein VirD4
MGHRVCVLDPAEATGGLGTHYPATFNPLQILKPGSPTLIEDAGLIADALVLSDRSNDPFFDDSSRMFIETLLLHVAIWPEYEGRRDLLTVHDLLSRAMERRPGEEEPWLKEEMLTNPAADEAVQRGARTFYDRSERELGSVLSTARRHLHFLSYRQLRPLLQDGPNAIDLGELKRGAMTIYLCVPAMRLSAYSRWVRLFINLTLAAIEFETTRPRHPVLLCLDEFPVLGYLKEIETASGLMAGLGCQIHFVLQDLTQLKQLYKDRWETILGNCGVIHCLGNFDTFSREWISRRLGQTTVVSPGRSEVSYDARVSTGASGRSWSQTTAPLLTPDEVGRLCGAFDPGLRQLVLRPGKQPMILQRAFYDKHELFQGRFDPD